MTIYILKKEKKIDYKSEKIVKELFSKELFHDEKGRPYLSSSYISISDTNEYWACAFDDTSIGIDIESIYRKVNKSVLNWLSLDEREYLDALSFNSSEWREEFLSIWTKKESYSKKEGLGLSVGFKSFSVLNDDNLFTKRYKDLVISATKDFEIEEIEFKGEHKKSALEAGADILDMFGCSYATLYDKLKKRGYSEEECETACSRLLELGYLNDNEYARSISEKCEKKGYSSKRTEFELKKKGIDNIISKEYSDKLKDGDKKRAQKLADSISIGKELDDSLRGKIARKLSSFGYEASLIYDIIDKLG